MGVRLATAERLTIPDGLALALLALLSIRIYETMIYLGPLLCIIILWRVWRAPSRPVIPTALYLSGRGVRDPRHDGRDLLGDPSPSAVPSRGSLAVGDQFLAEPAVRPRPRRAVVVVAWALIKPADLARNRPYAWAAVFLALLACRRCSPDRPAGSSARQVAVCCAHRERADHRHDGRVCVAYRATPAVRLPVFEVLRQPCGQAVPVLFLRHAGGGTARRPALTHLGRLPRCHPHQRPVAQRHHPGRGHAAGPPPYSLFVEDWVLTTQSVVLRDKPSDGVLAPPRDL